MTKIPPRTHDPSQSILETALHLFSTKGFFQTSMQDIRRRSGISIGSIYHYYKNKEDIALALYNALLEQMTTIVQKSLLAHPSFHDCNYHILIDLCNLTKEAPEAMQFLLYARHREFLSGLPPICSAKPFQLMLHASKNAMDKGEVRSMSPEVMVTTIFGGTMRLILLETEGLLENDLLDYFKESWVGIWLAIQPEA